MKRLRSLLALGLLLAACGDAKEAYKSLGGLQQLHSELTAKYGEQMSVNLNNGRSLSISLVNSKLQELPAGQKKQKALEIAAYAVDRYKDADKLEAVSVGFVVHKSYLVVNYSETTDQYRFDVRELKTKGSKGAI